MKVRNRRLRSVPKMLGGTARGLSRTATAFTLVELLVVIAIIGVLTACALWGLGAVRNKARMTSVITRLQQHANVLTLYATDYRDCFPYFTLPLPEVTLIVASESERPIEARYFEAYHAWSAALADGYYSGKYMNGPFRSPFYRPAPPGQFDGWGNDFFYPCVFLASPEFWNRETRQILPVQFSATRQAMVTFPARKSLIVHNLNYAPSALAAACVDGHASPFDYRQTATQTVDDGDPNHRYGGHRGGGEPMLHTTNGVKGVDVP